MQKYLLAHSIQWNHILVFLYDCLFYLKYQFSARAGCEPEGNHKSVATKLCLVPTYEP